MVLSRVSITHSGSLRSSSLIYVIATTSTYSTLAHSSPQSPSTWPFQAGRSSNRCIGTLSRCLLLHLHFDHTALGQCITKRICCRVRMMMSSFRLHHPSPLHRGEARTRIEAFDRSRTSFFGCPTVFLLDRMMTIGTSSMTSTRSSSGRQFAQNTKLHFLSFITRDQGRSQWVPTTTKQSAL